MPVARGQTLRRSPGEVREAIERFLAACREPVLLEPGELPIRLTSGNHAISVHAGRLIIEAWDAERNVARRVVDIDASRPGRLDLAIERFNKKTGTLTLADLGRPSGLDLERRGARLSFRERFRRSLARQLPGWKIAELTTECDLEHSLSPAYPRAFLKQGGSGWAAIGAAPDADDSAALSFGLIWLHHLRLRERRTTIAGLALCLPSGRRTACLRLPFLNARAAQFDVIAYSDNYEERLDPRDYGNLDTRLEAWRRPDAPDYAFERLSAVERVETDHRAVGFRVHGLEFARWTDGELRAGIDRKQPCSDIAAIGRLAQEIARVRAPDAADRTHPLYLRAPELWLESQVRASIETIDASLVPSPVYGQVPAFAGGERGVIDLLACERSGRLAVIELKATQDLHLPLQALDYWMRVKWHLDRGEFAGRGYFPGVAVRSEPPRLLLVAPALEFHPSTETILRYFSPEIEVERIGVGLDWRQVLKVMFRIPGAQRPD